MLVQLSTHTSSPTFTTTSSEVSLLGLSLEHLAKPNTEMAKRSKWSLLDQPPTPLLRFPIILSHNYVLIPRNVHPPKNISIPPVSSSLSSAARALIHPRSAPPGVWRRTVGDGRHTPPGAPRTTGCTTYHRPPTAPGRHTPGLRAPQRFSILRPMCNST